MTTTLKYIALAAVAAVALAACASGSVQTTTPATDPGIAVGEPAPGTNPDPAGACHVDNPDCVDIVVEGPESDRCMPDIEGCDDTPGPEDDIVESEPGVVDVDPVNEYRPIEVEGDVAGDGYVIEGGDFISAEGNQVRIGFWMGVESCFAVETVDVAETETKVEVAITVAPRDPNQFCIEVAEARSITIELESPIGGRLLEIGGSPN